ncbi:MAG: SycD/LcrH family type III secretion system chaperone [Deltaproteobacteria bacterium]|jgi:type III secretion system low calcium response chaperone LcrH/SycD|nr:SycD/LcrH family type III secretion system chaperone [Deltaproteobacteria bacterium]
MVDTTSEERLAAIVAKVLRGETVLRAELGMDNNDMEALYSVTYNVYMAGKYDEAMRLFGVLSLLDPTDYRFVFGGASCLQMLGEYMMASMYFQLAGGLDEEAPAPMLHTAECLLALKDRDGAKTALALVLERAGDKAEYAPLRKKAEVMLENVSA